jgi:hypothetical protein
MPVLGGCQILTLEAPLITEKAPCMYKGYVYSKDDFRSPFVKPPLPRVAIIQYFGSDKITVPIPQHRFYTLVSYFHFNTMHPQTFNQIAFIHTLDQQKQKTSFLY